MPNEHLLKGLVHAVFVRDALGYQDEPGIGNITVTFTDEQDWHENFPIERTEIHPIMFARKGIKTWAAVGICSDEIGISVFSKQTVDGGVLARVQYVPDDILRKILEA